MDSDRQRRGPEQPTAASGTARQFRVLDRRAWRAVPWLLCFWLSGCVNFGYYQHLASGQLQLLRQREPIHAVISDQRRDAELRARLALVVQARRFAIEALGLPDNRSYLSYVELGRRHVLWNLLAAPEFSVEARPQCFPLAGCVAYRGFFRRELAEAAAERLHAEGFDVWIGGVDAFSSLGWFADPVLSSMLHRDDEQLAGLIFHELAHQRFYLPGDSAFSESYASFVERQGLAQWRAARGLPPPDEQARQRQARFVRLILDTREHLRRLYALPLQADALRQAKAQVFAELREQYRRLREENAVADYDAFMAGPLNNASLLPFALYDQWVPAFARLFEEVGEDWVAFHAEVRRLGGLPGEQRRRRLAELGGEDNPPGSAAGSD